MNTAKIYDLRKELEKKFPEESYNSACSLFTKAYNAGVITTNDYLAAKDYYGTLWNYTGD